MANNRIQIKRSTANATVTGLNPGELAFTANGNILYIGNPADGASVRIAGLQSPGTLTANQALVANASSAIDKVIVANLVPTSIWANGAAGTTGDILFSNSSGGVFWAPSGGVNVAASYTWTNTHTFNANVLINGTLTTNSEVQSLAGVNSTAFTVGTNFVANTTQVSLGAGIKLAANGALGSANQVLRTDTNGVAYWATDAGDIESVTAGNGLSGGGTQGAVTLDVGAANGITVSADAVGVNLGANSGLSVNTSGLFVAFGNGLTTNSTTLAVVGSNGITSNTSGLFLATGSTLTLNTSGLHVNSTLSLTDLTLSGNLDVNGTLTTIDTQNLAVNDSIISLARGNAADTLDIGFYGTYNDGTARYTGLIWDTSTDVFELFANTTTEPTTTLDIGGTGYATATLKAYLQSGGLIANSSVTNITANSTYSVAIVANTLSLSTALPATSGGTGLSSITEDAILVGNSTGGFTQLALGTSGYVLQSNGSALVYDFLDGGTF